MKNLFSTKVILFGFLCLTSYLGLAQVITFDYTGSMQTYTVPPGVSTIQIETWGAQGGGSEVCGDITEEDGGLGGYATGELTVTPGEVLNIYVGGKPEIVMGAGSPGGYNGGGTSGQYGGGGGGASDVRIGGTDLDDRVIVAGGGGGGNTGCPDHGTGGIGGGLTGGDGIGLSGYDPGLGGTQFAGGAGAGAGSAGVLGVGGTGDYHVAGGGGGLYGGGGAYAAGGGGGSSYIGDLDGASTSSGVQSGDGQIIITILCIALSLEPTDTEICEGESFIVDASSETGGIVMWDGGVENGEEFFPGGIGSYTYTATSTSGTDCNLVVEITVHDLPTIIANADPETVCFGQELTLSGSGGAFYEWSDGIENGEPFVADELGTFTYFVEGEDWYGCFNSDEITVTVVESPDVVISASDDNLCLGESLTLTASGALTYEWDSDVENGVSFIPEETGTFVYNVEGYVDGEGCFGEATVEISVNEVPTIESFIMLGEVSGDDGSINITVTGGTPAYDFDWDNDGVGEFGDPEDLIGISGGTYTVIIKDANDCEDTETITVDTQLGLNDEVVSELKIFPNPSSDFVSILFEGNFTYNISSINGEILVSGSAVNSENLTISHFSDGIYIIDIQADNTIRSIRFVKE